MLIIIAFQFAINVLMVNLFSVFFLQDASLQFFRMFSDSASEQQLADYFNATLFTTVAPKKTT